MDMFYASVEIRDNPELADKPIAVGGMSMIATANYIARRFGVRSAMPGFIGKLLCPDLVFIEPNFNKYHEEGVKIREIFKEYDPDFESMGLDEGNLRVTEVLVSNGMDHDEGRQALARLIREKIWNKTQLAASAGIGCNKVLAKIATDMGKPNGQYYIPFTKPDIISFVSGLSIRKIPGIGKVLEKILNEFEIAKCADIMSKKLDLYLSFSEGTFDFLMSVALGIGPCFHPESRDDQKSISLSRSFRPTSNFEEIDLKIRDFCKEISQELEEKKAQARCFSVTIRNFRFETKGKSETLGKYIFKENEIYAVASRLFKMLEVKEKIGLIGVRAANLVYNQSTTIENLLEKMSQETITATTTKVVEQKCMICNKIFNYTEKRMEIHINQCLTSENRPNEKPIKKIKFQAQSNTLDKFLSKK